MELLIMIMLALLLPIIALAALFVILIVMIFLYGCLAYWLLMKVIRLLYVEKTERGNAQS